MQCYSVAHWLLHHTLYYNVLIMRPASYVALHKVTHWQHKA